jgi:hypothetical protein
MVIHRVEFSPTPGTEVPVVVHTHEENMMENPEPMPNEKH